MSATLELLVSDDAIGEAFLYGPLIRDKGHGYVAGAVMVRDLYEADRKTTHAELESLRATVQALVDALDGACAYARTYDDCPYIDGDAALSLAATKHNITPTT